MAKPPLLMTGQMMPLVMKGCEAAFEVHRYWEATDRDAFLRRSQAWCHLLDPATGLMRPRLNGRFKTPFDPTEVDFHFTEANSWQYSFFVPQDLTGLQRRLKHPDTLERRLDRLFGDDHAIVGQVRAGLRKKLDVPAVQRVEAARDKHDLFFIHVVKNDLA